MAIRTPTRAQPNGWIGSGEGSAMRTGREEVGPGQRNSHQGAAQRLDRFRGGYYHGWAHIKGNPKLEKNYLLRYIISLEYYNQGLDYNYKKIQKQYFSWAQKYCQEYSYSKLSCFRDDKKTTDQDIIQVWWFWCYICPRFIHWIATYHTRKYQIRLLVEREEHIWVKELPVINIHICLVHLSFLRKNNNYGR